MPTSKLSDSNVILIQMRTTEMTVLKNILISLSFVQRWHNLPYNTIQEARNVKTHQPRRMIHAKVLKSPSEYHLIVYYVWRTFGAVCVQTPLGVYSSCLRIRTSNFAEKRIYIPKGQRCCFQHLNIWGRHLNAKPLTLIRPLVSTCRMFISEVQQFMIWMADRRRSLFNKIKDFLFSNNG